MLKGKRVIVVGGSSGIGLQISRELLASGAKVVVASRSPKKLALAKENLNDSAITLSLDASDELSVQNFFAGIGEFDHLIVTIKSKHLVCDFANTSTESVHHAFDTKFWGQYYLARHCIPYLSKQGSITLTSGIAAQRGYHGFSSISAINGAIESLVKSLAVELAPMRINAVSPGFTERRPKDTVRFDDIKMLGGHPPLNRLGSQKEIADAYLFLMQNKYATGTILTIDGGELCA